MEADHLDPIADRLLSKPLAKRLGGAVGERGIGVRLDLELESHCLRDRVDQLLEQEWVLCRRRSRGVTDESRLDLFSGPPVRPAIEGGPEREQRIVKQNQPIVGGQADVGFEALDRAGQGVSKRSRRGVRAVVAAEPVCI